MQVTLNLNYFHLDVETKTEKGMRKLFGHVERMNARRLTNQIYKLTMTKLRTS